MNALTTTKSNKVRDVAASVRDWIASDGQSTTKEAKTGAQSALKEARKARANAESAVKEAKSGAESAIKEAKRARATAESAVKEARRAARKRMTRARVAAARTTASRPEVGGKKAIAAAGALGAAGAYFLDPQSGTRRRHMLRDKAEAIVRKVTDRVRRQKDYRVHQAEGKVEALKSKAGAEKSAANDQDLTDRVKSEIFRPADAPKGSVNINVEHGVVYLRGEVKRKGQIKELEKRARSINGVRGVENLLSR